MTLEERVDKVEAQIKAIVDYSEKLMVWNEDVHTRLVNLQKAIVQIVVYRDAEAALRALNNNEYPPDYPRSWKLVT